MLQGAFAPPYCPAFPAQRLGSISLCGGARSSCAHTNVFIQPPEVCRALNGNLKTHIPNLPRPVELSKFISAEWMGAEHCNLLANSDSDLLGLNPELQETNSKNGSRRALKVP